MPDDPLFGVPPEPGTPPNGSGAPAPAPVAPPAPAIDPQLTQTLETQQRQIDSLTTSVTDLAQTIRDGMNTPVPQAEVPPDPSDDLSRLSSDPRGLIREEAARVGAQVLQASQANDAQSLETMHSMLLDGQERAFVEEFGQEAWDQYVKPGLTQNYGQLRENAQKAGVLPTSLANRETMQALVDRLKGANWTTLQSSASEHAKTKEETVKQQREELVRGLPVAGLAREPGSRDVRHPGMDEFSSHLAKGGQAVDEKELQAHVGGDGSLSDFLAAQAKLEAANK